MATIYKTAERTVTCPECGQDATHTTYAGDVAVWTDDYDERGFQEQRTERLSDGFSVECHSCDFSDGEPPQY